MTACHEIISEEWNSRSRELAEWAIDHSGASPPDRTYGRGGEELGEPILEAVGVLPQRNTSGSRPPLPAWRVGCGTIVMRCCLTFPMPNSKGQRLLQRPLEWAWPSGFAGQGGGGDGGGR
jgi:hypothetical protein